MDPILPEPGSFDVRAMARGEPGVPRRFTWRGQRYEVAEVLAPSTRETQPCRHGSGERYVRRHVTRVRTTGGAVLTLSASRAVGTGPRWFVRDAVGADPLAAGPPA